jgi:hypothetical protein
MATTRRIARLAIMSLVLCIGLLSNARRAAALPNLQPALTAFYDPYHNGGTHHVVYIDNYGEIDEYNYQANLGYWQNVFLGLGARANGQLTGFAEPNQSHVFGIAGTYAGPHVHEFYGQQGLTNTNDLTFHSNSSGTPNAPRGTQVQCATGSGNTWGDCVSFASPVTSFWDGNTEHVFYLDTTGQVNELYYYAGQWNDRPLGGPPGWGYDGGGLTSVWDGSLEHVFYTGYTDYHVHELYFAPGWSNWLTGDWSTNSGADANHSPYWYLASTVTGNDSTPRVTGVRPLSPALQTLYRDSSWTWRNSAAQAPNIGVFSPVVEFTVNGNDDVFYVGTDGAIYESINGLNATELNFQATCPPPSGRRCVPGAVDTNSTFGGYYDGSYRYLYFQCGSGTSGNDIVQIYAQQLSENWAANDLTCSAGGLPAQP